MSNRRKLKNTQPRVKAQMRLMFCNGVEIMDEGPKLSPKEVARGVSHIQQMWEQEYDQLAAEFAEDEIDDDLVLHPIRISFETRATENDGWTQVWVGEHTCDCEVSS